MAFNIVNEKLKPLFDHTSDGVILLDRTLTILALNPSAENLLGWKSSDRIGKKFPREKLIQLHANQAVGDPAGPFNPDETSYDLELEVTLSLGEKIFLPAVSFPIKGGDGELLYGLILENTLLKYGMSESLIRQERLDDMTGLLHKEYFDRIAKVEMTRTMKHGGNLGAILVRIDNLNQISQKYGALKGTETIKRVGEQVKGNSRDVDLVCRYGENEFMVLLLNSDAGKMNIILSRLKAKLYSGSQSGLLPSTISITVGKALQNDEYEKIFEKAKLSLEKFI